MINLYRYLIVISVLLYVIFWLLPYFDYIWLNQEELSLASYNNFSSYINHGIMKSLSWVVFFVWMFIYLGLFFFIKIARSLFFMILIVENTIFNLLFGFSILPPISSFIGSFLGTIDGFVLAILYLTSVNKKFEKTT